MNMAYKVGVWSSREFLLASFVFVIATNYFMPIEARYIPGMNQLRQSLDGDDDDIDQDTSASYQNQDDNNNNNPSSDGYDDNEPGKLTCCS